MIKKYFGIFLIFFFSFIPVLIWFLIKSLSVRFGSWSLFFFSLGQISALLGVILFSLTLIISARLQIFERVFQGLNRVYKIHHTLGAISFILLLFHPLFLLSRTLSVSLLASAKFLLPGEYLSKDLGIYSLALMIIILILTFFVKMKYEFWKNSHKFLGAVFFLGIIHSFLIQSDISQNLFLKYYMITFASLGGSAYIYWTILGKWTTSNYLYKIIKKNILMDNIMEFTFLAQGKVMPYQAGQFVFATFNNKNLPREAHPFSISSNNKGNIFKLTIKTLGDYTQALKNVKIGETVNIEGAFGRFNYENFKNKKQIWLGAGIGITPFLGMAEELIKDNNKDNYNIDFYYCTRRIDEQFIIKNLLEKTKNIHNFSFISHCSKDNGWLNIDFLSTHSQDFKERDFLICGPPKFRQGLKWQLKKIGILNKKIHTEEFNF